uniref:Uncharacterized protein n=1 Tax=viral metagenome TaxID=1070528 RepID=A0A6C0BXG1_9ZZZZ
MAYTIYIYIYKIFINELCGLEIFSIYKLFI